MQSEKIWHGLDLRFTDTVGEFADHNGIVLCQDPSVNAPGPSTLLVRIDIFEAYLAQNGYKLCWIVFGQKQILSGLNAGTDIDHRIGHDFQDTIAWKLEKYRVRKSLTSNITDKCYYVKCHSSVALRL